jgi:membrane protein implicated in regulation of membrane protease activity
MGWAWLALAAALVAIELHHWAFYAMFGAAGALAAGFVAFQNPDAFGLQLLTALIVAVVGVLGVRPYVSRIADRHGGGHVARGVHGGIVGQRAMTLDEVGDEHRPGHALLAGERWLARSATGETIPAQTNAYITAVSGTTLVLSLDELEEGENE